MKKNLFVLLLAALLLLPGCSAMLAREYVSVSPHPDHPTLAEDPTVLKAENYQDLVNGIFSFVNNRVESGVIRLSNYVRDVEEDLSKACLEVANEDPLGAYSVDFIKYDYTRVVKYYEATISITYRRSPAQIQSIVNVTGSSAIREELKEKLAVFAPEAVLQVGYFTENADYISSLVRQAYYDTPAAAMGMPQFSVALYPARGTSIRRIVEITLIYPDDMEALQRKSLELLRQANSLSTELSGLSSLKGTEAIFNLLRERVTFVSPQEGSASTAHAALLDHRADSEGAALAVQLLLQTAQLEGNVVQGTLNGVPHFWNVVHLSAGEWRHVDVTAPEGLLLTDGALSAQGYAWNGTDVPACGASAPEPSAIQTSSPKSRGFNPVDPTSTVLPIQQTPLL